MTIDELLSRFENARRSGNDQWEAQCPTHDDGTNSLCISATSDGTLLMKCQAGCKTPDVLGAVGLTLKDLFPSVNGNGRHEHPSNGKKSEIVATYDYRTESGELEFQVVRRKPKDFRQRRPNPDGGWINNVSGCRVLPFHLPELSSSALEQLVFIPEGERDVLSLEGIGLVATCNAGGAGKWKAEHAKWLTARDVVILPDNDDPGRQHGQQVARSLVGIASTVKTLELPGLQPKGDVSDWIQSGGTKEQLLELVAAAEQGKEKLPDPNGNSPIVVKLAEVQPEEVTWFWPNRIPMGKLSVIAGDPGLGKSFLTIDFASRCSTGTKWFDCNGNAPLGSVVILNAEDALADTIRPRLDASGANCEKIVALQAVRGNDQAGSYERSVDLQRDLAILEQTVVIAEMGASTERTSALRCESTLPM